MLFAITGVPGTGKSTLSRELSKKTGWALVEINRLIEEKGLWNGTEMGAKIVDMNALAREIAALARKNKNRNLILEGHLLCDLKTGADFIVVLRTNPAALRKRLAARGYPKKKIDENVMAEALDYCTLEAESRYEKVYEIDTTKSRSGSLSKLLLISTGKGKRFASGKINWLKELKKEITRTTI